MAYDLPLALDQLVRDGRLTTVDNWGPLAQSGVSYGLFANAWVGPSAVPTEAELEAAQIAAEAYHAGQQTTTTRADAVELIDFLQTALGKALRAEAAVLCDEINLLRQWITSFKAATAAASSLADFKTRVAALPNMPDRTLAQAKTAIINKINGGSVD